MQPLCMSAFKNLSNKLMQKIRIEFRVNSQQNTFVFFWLSLQEIACRFDFQMK